MTNLKLTPNKLSIIIPAYDEGRTIHLILDKIKNVNLLNELHKEIIVVNDCSTQNKYYEYDWEGIKIIHLKKNSKKILGGKGTYCFSASIEPN